MSAVKVAVIGALELINCLRFTLAPRVAVTGVDATPLRIINPSEVSVAVIGVLAAMLLALDALEVRLAVKAALSSTYYVLAAASKSVVVMAVFA